MEKHRKGFLHILLGAFVGILFSLSAIFVFLPVNFASAEENLPSDYNAFYQSFMQMQESSSTSNDGIAIISAESEQTPNNSNRLIVYSESYVPSCGAKWEARYKEWSFFQFETYGQAENAYDYLVEQNFDVCYDANVEINENSNDALAYNTVTHVYNTWADEYMHYDAFVSTQLDDELDDVYVFVLDTGINKEHVLFQNRIEESLGNNFVGYQPKLLPDGRTNADYSYYDDHYKTDEKTGTVTVHGHGTHTSGTIAELTKDNVKIVPYKVLNQAGSGSVSGIIAAINSMIDIKTKNPSMKMVANMSLGVDYSDTSENPVYSSLNRAVNLGADAGIAFVVSAGNECQNTSNVSPASSDKAIVVSALKNGGYLNDGLVFDSSYSNFGVSVDFSAPGTGILSASNLSKVGYQYMSGTSMAAPHISACYALMFSLPKYQNFEEITNVFTQNCVDLGRTGKDDYYGYGYIDMNYIERVFSKYTVEFSEQTDEEKALDNFTFSLSFNEEGASDIEIYYTFDVNASQLDKNTWTLYENPVKISSSQKVSAVALYKDSQNRVGKTKVASHIYYVNNFDIDDNFEFVTQGFSAVITRYKGTGLKTLNLPSEHYENGRAVNVTGIESFAFNSGNVVEILNLPSSITTIEQNAFNGAESLVEINGSRISSIKNFAFQGCKNLQRVNFSDSVLTRIGNNAFGDCVNLFYVGNSFQTVTTIGSNAFSGCTNLSLDENTFKSVENIESYAFQNCQNLNVLTLPKVKTIGEGAFYNSKIEELLLGKNLNELTIDYEAEIKKVFAYNSPKILDREFEFVDLNLRVITPLEERIKYIEKDHPFKIEIEFVGYSVEIAGGKGRFEQIGDKTNNFTYIYGYTFDGAESSTNKIYFKDAFLNYIDAYGNACENSSEIQTFSVNVVDENTKTHKFTYVGDNYKLKINGVLVTEKELTFYEGNNATPFGYEIEIIPDDGWQVSRISLSTRPYSQSIDNKTIVLTNVTQDITLTVVTILKEGYTLNFYHDGGEVYIGETKIDEVYSVLRGQSVKIVVKEDIGFEFKGLFVNGTQIEANEDGSFDIPNILSDLTIKVLFETVSYKVQVQSGAGGTVSFTAEGENISRGESRTYQISTSEGYVIDYVTVNGVPITLKGNTFTIENVTQDILIVISFKKQSGGFLSGDSVLLDYTIIFIIMLVVFAILKLVIYLIRRKRPDLRKY